MPNDTERIDFLNRHGQTVEFDGGRVSWVVRRYREDSPDEDWPYEVVHIGNGSIRESIDWAIAHPAEIAPVLIDD